MKSSLKTLMVAVVVLFVSTVAFANKTAVTISTSAQKVKKGTEVTITLNVTHKGNSKMHHTEWVTLKINGKEVKKWSYDKHNLPPDSNFSLTYKAVVDDGLKIEAEGSCNMHGSAGVASAAVVIE